MASTLIEPLLAFRETEAASTLREAPAGRNHAAEAARLVMIREAIAAYYENAGRYPKDLDELVTGRWLGGAARSLRPHRQTLLCRSRHGLHAASVAAVSRTTAACALSSIL